VKKTTVADNKKDKEFTDFEKIGKKPELRLAGQNFNLRV
jgi:hypothetical protein